MKTRRSTQLANPILIALNLVGAIAYLARASNAWAIPQEAGLNSQTAEPFIWAMGILPIVTVFFVINLIWGTVVLIRTQWRSVRSWLLAALVWLIAIVIDFKHH